MSRKNPSPMAYTIVILTSLSEKNMAKKPRFCYNQGMEKKVYTADELNNASSASTDARKKMNVTDSRMSLLKKS